MASRGRGASWVIKITFPHAFTGADVEWQAGGGTAITVPFATERSAREAMAATTIGVAPGEDHVIAGTVIAGELETGDGDG
jgi:hypothetical protein